MRYIEFETLGGDAVAVNADQIGAVLHRQQGETTIRIVGRSEDIHVQGEFSEVLEMIKGPLQFRGRIPR